MFSETEGAASRSNGLAAGSSKQPEALPIFPAGLELPSRFRKFAERGEISVVGQNGLQDHPLESMDDLTAVNSSRIKRSAPRFTVNGMTKSKVFPRPVSPVES
jgi:hypothetical protein